MMSRVKLTRSSYSYPYANEVGCPVRLGEKYVLPTTKKCDVVYMRPKVCDQTAGILIDLMVSIEFPSTVKRMRRLIGKSDKKYVNQNLRATMATRMTNENVDIQVIKDFTGEAM